MRNEALIAASIALFASACPDTGRAADFVPREVKVCAAAANVRDPEFDRATQRMTWFDTSGNVKVSQIDEDGTITSPACMGTVIDTGGTLRVNEFPLLNASEWAHSQFGTEIYYTKLDANNQPALARAWRNGIWQNEFLPNGVNRGLPIPSVDSTDLRTRIFYAYQPPGEAWQWRWRDMAVPNVETAFPGPASQASGGAPRWVAGQRAISTVVSDAQGVPQAARYLIDTGAVEQLTSDAGSKDEVWMWTAPEFGEQVFTTVVDRRKLRVYRKVGSVWTVVKTIELPDDTTKGGLIFSPEPFIYKGKSYVVMQLSRQKYAAAEIWIAAIDPANTLLRRVSDPTKPTMVRSEPEFMETPRGAFIYYSVVEGQDKASLYRADTGL